MGYRILAIIAPAVTVSMVNAVSCGIAGLHGFFSAVYYFFLRKKLKIAELQYFILTFKPINNSINFLFKSHARRRSKIFQ